MKSKGVSNAHALAVFAQQELDDLAILEGREGKSGERMYYRLKKSFKNMPREEDVWKNRFLDCQDENGYVPSRDVVNVVRDD